MRYLSLTILVVLMHGGLPLTADDVPPARSPVGKQIESFQVKDCSGPAAGKTLCYACRYAGRPVVAVFARDLGGDVMRLVKRIDDEVVRRRDQRMAAFVVLLAHDTSQTEQQLKDLAQDHRLQRTPLTIYRGDQKKLQTAYGLAPDAAVTVVVWRDWRIRTGQSFDSTRFGDPQTKQVVTGIVKALD